MFDARHDREAESADSSPVVSTVLAAKKTLWFFPIPKEAGSKANDVSVIEEASGASDAEERPASVVQYNVYRTVSPSIAVPFVSFVTGSQKSSHVPADVDVAILVIPRVSGAIGTPTATVLGGEFQGRTSANADSSPVLSTDFTEKYTVW